MNSGITFKYHLINLLLLFCSGLTVGQENKVKAKSPKAFISIAYQDIKGQGITAYQSKRYEKAYNAIGDKTILSTMMLNDFLRSKQQVQKNSIFLNLNYINLLKECPVICANREADPYLMALSCFMYFFRADTGDLNTKYLKAIKWQKIKAPNAPFGVNEAPEMQSEHEEMEWGMLKAAKWMLDFPEEYKNCLAVYNNNYKTWKLQNPKGNRRQYLEYLVTSLYPDINDGTESAYYKVEKSEFLPNTIPDSASMHKNPEAFIKELYESILLRNPTQNEVAELADFIRKNPTLKPSAVYFALMTSNEYNFY